MGLVDENYQRVNKEMSAGGLNASSKGVVTLSVLKEVVVAYPSQKVMHLHSKHRKLLDCFNLPFWEMFVEEMMKH